MMMKMLGLEPEAGEPLGKIFLINAHFFLRVMVGCSNMASEPVHAVAMCGGDATTAMRLLASSSALSGLLQWALNPTFGKLSDRYDAHCFHPSAGMLSRYLSSSLQSRR